MGQLSRTCLLSTGFTTALVGRSCFIEPSAAAAALGIYSKQPWGPCVLRFVHDPLLLVHALWLLRTTRQCAVNVLKIQIGHVAQRPENGCWSVSHVTCHSILLAHRTSAFYKIIGRWSYSRVIFLYWAYLKYFSRAIRHEVKRANLEEMLRSVSMCQRNPYRR